MMPRPPDNNPYLIYEVVGGVAGTVLLIVVALSLYQAYNAPKPSAKIKPQIRTKSSTGTMETIQASRKLTAENSALTMNAAKDNNSFINKIKILLVGTPNELTTIEKEAPKLETIPSASRQNDTASKELSNRQSDASKSLNSESDPERENGSRDFMKRIKSLVLGKNEDLSDTAPTNSTRSSAK